MVNWSLSDLLLGYWVIESFVICHLIITVIRNFPSTIYIQLFSIDHSPLTSDYSYIFPAS